MTGPAEQFVVAQIDRRFAASVEEIQAAIRQPSVARTGEGIPAMAEPRRLHRRPSQ
jgi:hypothetical protein